MVTLLVKPAAYAVVPNTMELLPLARLRLSMVPVMRAKVESTKDWPSVESTIVSDAVPA